eukprot:Skav216058  [mRNA]  locus=scaffold2261:53995:57249:+ [translate_table: standard]
MWLITEPSHEVSDESRRRRIRMLAKFNAGKALAPLELQQIFFLAWDLLRQEQGRLRGESASASLQDLAAVRWPARNAGPRQV